MFTLIAYGCLLAVLVTAGGIIWAIAHTGLSDAPLGTVTPRARYHCRANTGREWDSSTVTKHARYAGRRR